MGGSGTLDVFPKRMSAPGVNLTWRGSCQLARHPIRALHPAYGVEMLLTCHQSVISKCQLSSVMLMEDDKRQSEKERGRGGERERDRWTEKKTVSDT